MGSCNVHLEKMESLKRPWGKRNNQDMGDIFAAIIFKLLCKLIMHLKSLFTEAALEMDGGVNRL